MAEENPKPTIPPPQQELSPPHPEPNPSVEPPSDPPLTTEKDQEPPQTVVPESEPTAGTEVKQEDLSSLSEVQEPEKEPPPPQPEVEEPVTENPPVVKVAEPEVSMTTSSAEESEKEKSSDERRVPESLVSFKEESNVVADLSDSERKAFQQLKQMVQDGVKNHVFGSPQGKEAEDKASKGDESDASTEMNPNPIGEGGEEMVSIWGVPLLKDDRTDVILLKFLRARDFKVKDAFGMLKSTMQWRREFGINALLDEDLGDDQDKVVFMHGYDRDGHPVCYNVYGEFQNKELYQKTFGDEEKREKFLRWRIQFLERSIRKLDFSPGGINTIFQVNDLKNSPGPGKRELRIATKFALQLLQDNYPEFVAKQVFINVPWWYLAFYSMINPFLTQRTKSKFVFAGPSKTAETLFKYISPEHVPVQYGGLSVDYCDCNPEFTIADPATEMTVKPGTKQTVEIIVYEKCILVWELRVVGWEVSYSAEFTPNAKDAYTVIIEKPRKMTPSDEPVVSSSFKVSDLGKVLLTIDNPTSKRKKLIYRFKVNTLSD